MVNLCYHINTLKIIIEVLVKYFYYLYFGAKNPKIGIFVNMITVMPTNNPQTLAIKIGMMIAKKRKAKHLTQAILAEKLDISVDAISKMERGQILPSVARLNELATILDCETAEFLTQSSPVLSDQVRRLTELLAPLDESQREELIQIIEQIIAWQLTHQKTPP